MNKFITSMLMVFLLGLTFVSASESILALTPLTATEGEQYNGDLILAGTAQGLLTFSLVSGPEGMVIDTDTGDLTWTPSASQVGSHDITITVTDDSDGITTVFDDSITVISDPNDFIEILEVEVDNVDAIDSDTALSVERGDGVTIEVQFLAETTDD